MLRTGILHPLFHRDLKILDVTNQPRATRRAKRDRGKINVGENLGQGESDLERRQLQVGVPARGFFEQ